MLIVKYERKDFFGRKQYTEDIADFYGKPELKKAFLALGKDHDIAVQVDNVLYAWDSMSEFENRILLVRTFDSETLKNYVDNKRSFDTVKKEIYGSYQ